MIHIYDLKKQFGDKEVLRGVSLNIKKGCIYGLIGKNGAGKTTLINIIAGLANSDFGKCIIDGTEIKRGSNMPCNIGYLPDIPSFFDSLRVEEYLRFLMKDIEKQRKIKKIQELLALVELERNIPIKNMSRGMKQRLGIASALINDPEVILLDEPTSALDPAGRCELMEILKKLKNEGKTIVLSTHILTDMEKVCDKVGFLSNGKIVREVIIHEIEMNSKEIRIIFDTVPTFDSIEKEGLQYIKINEKEYIFKVYDVGNQKSLFQFLSRLDTSIIGIKKELYNLDDMFQEVCG